jgi:hypothetical protein
MRKTYLIFFIVICSVIFGKNSFAQNKQLYFCEKYENSEEIGISDKFTTGWLTVMVDLRESGETMNTSEVELVIVKIKDSDGNPVNDTIDVIPFDVEPDWDYIYFADNDRVGFSEKGTFKVICRKKDGTTIASGEVEIVDDAEE